jgi:hypothetical protein
LNQRIQRLETRLARLEDLQQSLSAQGTPGIGRNANAALDAGLDFDFGFGFGGDVRGLQGQGQGLGLQRNRAVAQGAQEANASAEDAETDDIITLNANEETHDCSAADDVDDANAEAEGVDEVDDAKTDDVATPNAAVEADDVAAPNATVEADDVDTTGDSDILTLTGLPNTPATTTPTTDRIQTQAADTGTPTRNPLQEVMLALLALFLSMFMQGQNNTANNTVTPNNGQAQPEGNNLGLSSLTQQGLATEPPHFFW